MYAQETRSKAYLRTAASSLIPVHSEDIVDRKYQADVVLSYVGPIEFVEIFVPASPSTNRFLYRLQIKTFRQHI